jgi:pimeloyl-ACP methyl ester carboxylesterase
MATFVLVGGAWLGAWAWADVASRLRAQGHDVYPISLTGLADRVHLASPDVNLETHIADIVNTLVSHDLRDVVLAGHSYAGAPITGAGDRAADRIAKLVYVDTSPIADGTSLADATPPAAQAIIDRHMAEEGDGWRWPLPSWDEFENVLDASLAGISDEQRTTFRARATPHPFGTYRQALRILHPDARPLPKLGILCSFTEAQLREWIAAGHPWGRAISGPEWQFVELPTGHWPMFSEPAALARILDEAGS